MKSLKEYIIEKSIKESFNSDTNTVDLYNLIVKYTGPIEIHVQVPVSYDTDDVQIYLDDILLNKLPGGNECDSTKLFGDNIDNINDTHFEIDNVSFEEESNTSFNDTIQWDKSYNPKNNTENMKIAVIKNIIYIIEFTDFSIISVTKETYKDKLSQIFEDTVSDNYKYPIELNFNSSNMKYKY